MTEIEILAIAAPVVGGMFVGVLVFVTNHLDNKKADAERDAHIAARNDNPPRPAPAAE
ncbi:MAG: hypothetical protein ABWY18_06995 [Tardiphaga sp.]